MQQWKLAFMMATSAMFTLAGYELMRSATTVLFKSTYGAENLPFVMAVMPAVMLVGVWGYGKLLSRLGPRRTLNLTTLLSACAIVTGWLLFRLGAEWVTPILFLLKEFYVVLLIEQYWSYLNSSLTEASAKKMNGPITGIAGFGAVLGGAFVAHFAVSVGTDLLIPISAFALLPSAWLANRTQKTFGEPTQHKDSNCDGNDSSPDADVSIPHDALGFRTTLSSAPLRALFFVILSAQLIAAVLDFKFQGLLSESFTGRADEETAFQGQFWFYLNAAAVAFQFLATPVLLSKLPLSWVHFLVPTVHATTIAWALWEPSILSVGVAYFFFKMFDYSLFRGAKELIYLPLDFASRYRAKEFIDVFGYRTGKGGSSLVILALQKLGVQMMNYYLYIAFSFVLVWLALVPALTSSKTRSVSPQANEM